MDFGSRSSILYPFYRSLVLPVHCPGHTYPHRSKISISLWRTSAGSGGRRMDATFCSRCRQVAGAAQDHMHRLAPARQKR